MRNNKLNIIYIYKILEEYSDEDHILRMKDITNKMQLIYGVTIDRRTVYTIIDTLKEGGYDISDYKENEQGYYLRERPLEVYELSILMDSVYSSNVIPEKQTEELIKRLQGLMSVHNRKVYKNLTVVKSFTKTSNQEIFLNVDLLDEAIENRKQVSFTYLDYDFDKKLKPRREKKYVVNPYRLSNTDGKYYLICKKVPYDNVSFYRIDLIKDIEKLDEDIDSDITEKELENALTRTKYAWYGEVKNVTVRCKNALLREVIDEFGKDVIITKDEDKDYFTVVIKSVAEGIVFWALRFLSQVEIISPESVRNRMVDIIKNNPYIKLEDDSSSSSESGKIE